MMGVLFLLKQIIHKLIAPAIDPVEEPVDTWEDILIRLALKQWIWHVGRTPQKWLLRIQDK